MVSKTTTIDIFFTDNKSQDLLIHKCSSLNFESVDKHSKAVTFVAKEFNDSVDTDSEKWYLKKVKDLLDLWSHKAKHIMNSSTIHELYIQYLNQSQSLKDLTKTDYTYSKSISYNKNISNTDWLVPNMCRKSISSFVKTSTQMSRTLNTNTKTEIINNSINSSNVTPNAVKRATNKCPLIFRFVVLLLFLTPCIYLLSHYISSPLPYSSFDGLVSDYAAKDAINALIKEMKTMRNDLNQLRQTNSDMNSKMKNNEFNENEKFTHLSEKMDKIEEYLNNSLKNCCQNNTESLIALIDLRLSAFMSSLLSNNQNTRQSMSPSEAVEELKSFINFELMKTNDVFRESIEQKLMTTIEKFEEQMKRESKSITSNITIGKVRSLISEALAVYDADKTGQPDYALEPSGGTIINTRCSETYDPHGVECNIHKMKILSTIDKIKSLISEALDVYNTDKTGQPDLQIPYSRKTK
ncbi:uncharacterized protein LOC128965408 [Oppia nitens]|uniref:uncharacterized protein LOC128965408 n=1 Tax=Oppia nitens TaxID=1686743 RepID=UPI0023DAF678|nr:uncharacterized protein LOC128965408 [Oppia nitens]